MSSIPEAISLEVITHLPTDFFHCTHCERIFNVAGVGEEMHAEIQSSYPPEILEDAERLAEWLEELSTRYDQRLEIRVVDAWSLAGFIKSIRFGARCTPAFVVGHQEKVVGWKWGELDRVIQDQIDKRVT